MEKGKTTITDLHKKGDIGGYTNNAKHADVDSLQARGDEGNIAHYHRYANPSRRDGTRQHDAGTT